MTDTTTIPLSITKWPSRLHVWITITGVLLWQWRCSALKCTLGDMCIHAQRYLAESALCATDEGFTDDSRLEGETAQ